MKMALTVVLVLAALIMVVSIMFQKSNSSGLAGLVSGGSNENFFSKNKIKTKEKMAVTITTISAIIFVASVIGLALV